MLALRATLVLVGLAIGTAPDVPERVLCMECSSPLSAACSPSSLDSEGEPWSFCRRCQLWFRGPERWGMLYKELVPTFISRIFRNPIPAAESGRMEPGGPPRSHAEPEDNANPNLVPLSERREEDEEPPPSPTLRIPRAPIPAAESGREIEPEPRCHAEDPQDSDPGCQGSHRPPSDVISWDRIEKLDKDALVRMAERKSFEEHELNVKYGLESFVSPLDDSDADGEADSPRSDGGAYPNDNNNIIGIGPRLTLWRGEYKADAFPFISGRDRDLADLPGSLSSGVVRWLEFCMDMSKFSELLNILYTYRVLLCSEREWHTEMRNCSSQFRPM